MFKVSLTLICLALAGCGGTKDLGIWHLPDGQQINAYQVRSKGVTGPTITAIGLFKCNPIPERPNETGHADLACEPLQGYHAASGGLLESLSGGIVSTMIQAGVTYGVGTALVQQHSEVLTEEGTKNRDTTKGENEKKIKADAVNQKEKIAADKTNKPVVTVITPPVTVIAPIGPPGPKGETGDKGAPGEKGK